MASKRRIHQVAKEFNVSNEALISFLVDAGHDVHSPMTALTDEMYEKVTQKYKKVPEKKDREIEFRQQIRDKHLKEERTRDRARHDLEERMRVATRLMEARARRKKVGTSEPAPPSKDTETEDISTIQSPKTATPTDGKDEKAKPAAKRKTAARAKKAGEGKETVKKKAKDKAAAGKEEAAAKKEPSLEESIGKLIPKEDLRSADERREALRKLEEEEKSEKKKEKAGAEGEETSAPKKRRRRRRKKKKSTEAEAAEKVAATKKADGKAATTVDAKKRRKKRKKRKISEEEIQASIRETLAAMEGGTKSKAKRRRARDEGVEDAVEEDDVIKIAEFASVSDLAKKMEVEPNEVIKACLKLGMIVSINQRLDSDTIVMVADEFGFDIEIVQEYGTETIEAQEEEDDPELLEKRSPVVTIMGHVDHGKTSLLDYLRKSSITEGESGGITQHIGAYEVLHNGSQVTFLDTPGHEAFTAMRARGAQVTDVVVLIVSADDGVQQQTIEAISHAKAAGVPMVIAINKIDKPNANPDMIKQQLSQHDILVESWGGKYQSAEISAKTGEGIDQLLELILLEAELLDLKAIPDKLARGIVVEAELDKGKGPVATVLVQNGTLQVGDPFIAGHHWGKVRAMYDEYGRRKKEAPPSTPVQVVGFSGVPSAGDILTVMKSDQESKSIAMKRQQLKRVQDFQRTQHFTLDQFSQRMKEGEVKELLAIVKADVDGSLEALSDSLLKLSTSEVSVKVIHKGVGGISESDVLLAAASNAVIFGFHVRATQSARELADREKVDIRIYKIIYDAVNDVKAALEGMLDPELSEEITSSVEVRETFKVPKVGVIAGCYVQSGKVHRNENVRLYRDDKLIHEGKINSLKRFKDDVKEVASGFECGIKIEGYDDVHVGDVIETYKVIETKRSLASVS